MRPTAQRGPGGHPDSRTPPARNRGCHLSGCPGKPYRRSVHRPRVDQHTTLVVTTSRNTLPIAWATHPVPVIDTRPTVLVLADDAVAVVVADLGGIRVIADDRVGVGVSCPVRCGCEAERQACAERGLDDDEGDGAIHVIPIGLGLPWPNGLMWTTLHDQQ